MIIEYIYLLFRNSSNFKNIFKGFKNKFIFWFLLYDLRELALTRRDICINCLSFSVNAKKEGYRTNRIDNHCTICTCNIEAKTLVKDEKCLINLW